MSMLISRLMIGLGVVIFTAMATRSIAEEIYKKTKSQKLIKIYRVSNSIWSWCWIVEYILAAMLFISLLWG